MKAPFAVGRRVYLRGLEKEDLPALVTWINDTDVTHLLYTGDRPASLQGLEEVWLREQRDSSTIVFAVCTRAPDRIIGTAGLYGIHWIMRSGEFRIFLGDKTKWNRGFGTECTKLIVAYGFEKLNLNRIWLGVNAEHRGAVRVYERAGFLREGRLRQEQYRNFRYYDVLRMGLLRRDYEKRRASYADSRGRP